MKAKDKWMIFIPDMHAFAKNRTLISQGHPI